MEITGAEIEYKGKRVEDARRQLEELPLIVEGASVHDPNMILARCEGNSIELRTTSGVIHYNGLTRFNPKDYRVEFESDPEHHGQVRITSVRDLREFIRPVFLY